MFHRVIVKRFDSFLFIQIVRVGLGRAERVLKFSERAAEETAQLRLDLFGVFRLCDRSLHFVVRFRRGLLERIHEIVHLALSRLLQTTQPRLLCFRRRLLERIHELVYLALSRLLQTIQHLLLCFRRAATLNNQNKPHGFFLVFVFF